jgi:hypothetical protein
MAHIAGFRISNLDMIGVCGLFVFGKVARRTIRKDAILPPNNRLMTSLAFHGGVGADQGKKIGMVSYLLPRGEPALHNMALGAIRAKLAQMNIGVAIGAILADVREDRLRVALRAGDSRVSAAQLVLCFVMIEIYFRAEGSPRGGLMTVLAGHGQWTVRAGGSPSLGRRKSADCIREEK